MSDELYLSLKRKHFQIKETIVTIISEKNQHIDIAIREIKKIRYEIEKYIKKNPTFEITFKPYDFNEDDPNIIKKMCRSSEIFNIGPMSTVAGTIAEYAVKAMVSNGSKYAIVDNGGDIAIFSNKKVNVGVYTGNENTGCLAFEILPKNKITGVCTSSGKIGHSFSFGNSDAVTVFSKNISVADAAATIIGNIVNRKKDIKKAFRIIENITDITGAMIVIDDKIGLWGNVPKIVAVNVPYELITRGR